MALAQHLRYDNVLSYQDQIRVFCSKGFALWDLVQSCHREGSLDSNIEEEIMNDIPAFCEQNPSIRRIVLANGKTGAALLKRHVKDWCKSGKLRAGTNEASQQALKRFLESGGNGETQEEAMIDLICALSVSPAASMYSYKQKRDSWEELVYQPGLKDFQEQNS